MKNLFLSLALLMMASFGFAQTKIVFASDATYPPMEFIDANKTITGYSVEIADAAAKIGGFTAIHKSVAWDGIFAGLAAGDYDAILSSVTITPERQKAMDFSDPYATVGQVIIMQKSATPIKTLEAFTGKKMGGQIGTTGIIMAGKVKGVTTKTYDEIGLAVEDLAQGRIDGVICDNPTAANYVLQNAKYKDKLVITSGLLTSEPYGIAVPKGDPKKILPLINKALAELKKNGEMDRLKKKWLGN